MTPRLHHLTLAAALILGSVFLAHTALKAALTLTEDLTRAEQGAGW